MRITAGSRPLVTGRKEFSRASKDIVALGSRCAGDRMVEVTLIGEKRMASLNRDYKGRRGAAEILTFVYDDDPAHAPEGPAGEILVCWKRLSVSADAMSVPRRAYLLRLVAHGLCHMEGFSHGNDVMANRMEERERDLLSGLLTDRELGRLFPKERTGG